MLQKNLLLLFLIVGVTGCGGGGGDGETSNGRTTSTALRIIHGSIDSSPVSLRQGTNVMQTARYAQAKDYVEVQDPNAPFVLETANTPGDIIMQLPTPLKQDTEYSIFVYGNVGDRSFSTILTEDVALRPDSGRALLQVRNAYHGSSVITATATGGENGLMNTSLGEINFGHGGRFIDVASGLQTVVIRNKSGRQIASVAVNIPDQGEAVLLVTGSSELGVVFTPVYTDLD